MKRDLPAEALERLLVRGIEQLLDALVHNPGRQHLQLVELADDPDVAQ